MGRIDKGTCVIGRRNIGIMAEIKLFQQPTPDKEQRRKNINELKKYIKVSAGGKDSNGNWTELTIKDVENMDSKKVLPILQQIVKPESMTYLKRKLSELGVITIPEAKQIPLANLIENAGKAINKSGSLSDTRWIVEGDVVAQLSPSIYKLIVMLE